MIEANHAGVVFVVDDDAGIRRSMKSLFSCVGLETRAFSTATAAMEALNEGEMPVCFICDMRMPGMSGLDFLREVRKRDSYTPFVMLTGYGDIEMAVECMRLGAADFLEKPMRPQALLDRIQKLISDSSDRRERCARNNELAGRFEKLTARERQVVDHVLAGATSKAIAVELGISAKTVHVHRASASRKMCANSVAELAHLVDLARTETA